MDPWLVEGGAEVPAGETVELGVGADRLTGGGAIVPAVVSVCRLRRSAGGRFATARITKRPWTRASRQRTAQAMPDARP